MSLSPHFGRRIIAFQTRDFWFRTWTVLATPSRSSSAASFAAPTLNNASAIDPGLPG